jgi:alkanesulfonate monooxygenase SsuD/methylene tetrahydromethanopterin reductase-like flavin-dependent oxidoreductase (luciferase family)
MRFGLFGAAQAGARPGSPMGQGFADFIDFNIEAEALGYHSTFLVEHHFSGWNQVSATLTLLTWLAARTTTLRLGTAVLVLPWHNPVLLAEQAATLDLLSRGRLDFGIGKGYRYNEFTGFAVPREEADARFEESLAIITKAWTSEQRFSHRGRFWTFNDIVVEPPTWQKPHPPIWMGAGSAASIGAVAARGGNLILDQFAQIDVIGERIALFKSAQARLGPAPFAQEKTRLGPAPFAPTKEPRIALARDMHVASSPAEKRPRSRATGKATSVSCRWRAGPTMPAARTSWPTITRPRRSRRRAWSAPLTRSCASSRPCGASASTM